MLSVAATAHAQSRGVYPLGMTAVGSGVTPAPGFTYANQLLFYSSRDESKADDGSTLPVSGQNAVIMDMNSFVWVSQRTFLGGAHYSAVATLPVAKNQLVSDIHGQLSGGGGFADSVPTCRSSSAGTRNAPRSASSSAPSPQPGASPRVPATTWDWGIRTPTLSSGQTLQLTSNNAVTFSAFELYEWHTTQHGTGTKPGDTINLDYSLIRTFAFAKGPTRLQVGLVGYEQRQTTAKAGPAVSEDQTRERYAINALGFVTNLVFPNHRFNAGVRFFEEFGNRAAYQGTRSRCPRRSASKSCQGHAKHMDLTLAEVVVPRQSVLLPAVTQVTNIRGSARGFLRQSWIRRILRLAEAQVVPEIVPKAHSSPDGRRLGFRLQYRRSPSDGRRPYQATLAKNAETWVRGQPAPLPTAITSDQRSRYVVADGKTARTSLPSTTPGRCRISSGCEGARA